MSKTYRLVTIDMAKFAERDSVNYNSSDGHLTFQVPCTYGSQMLTAEFCEEVGDSFGDDVLGEVVDRTARATHQTLVMALIRKAIL